MAEGEGRGEVWRTSDALSIQRHVGLGHCGGQQPTAKNDRARFFLLNIQIGTHFVNLRPRVYHTSRVFENVNREEVGRNTVTGLQGESTSNSGDGSLRFASRRRPGVLLTTPPNPPIGSGEATPPRHGQTHGSLFNNQLGHPG